MKKTVLITGAKGTMGTLLREGLKNQYNLRLLGRHAIPDTETIIADISDLDAMVEASKGVDSIIHLAAVANRNSSFDEILQPNIIGTYNVYEAAARNKVKQVIFTSSNHAVGSYDLERDPEIYQTGKPVIDHTVAVRPDGFYGVSKCFGEELGRYYADHHGLHVLCLRIGFVNRNNNPFPLHSGESLERLGALWLSHRDTVQLYEKCLLADEIPYEIVYGISNNKPHYYDLEHAREVLGYEPVDGAIVANAPKRE